MIPQYMLANTWTSDSYRWVIKFKHIQGATIAASMQTWKLIPGKINVHMHWPGLENHKLAMFKHSWVLTRDTQSIIHPL